MGRPKVLIASNGAPQAGIDLLKTKCDVTIIDTSNPTPELILSSNISQFQAMMVVKHFYIGKDFLDAAGPNLKILSTMSAGYDHFDVPEIKKRGIQVGYTPKVLSGAVAEIAILLCLSAARRAYEGRMILDQGTFKTEGSQLLGHEVFDSTFGIVGLGNIGQEILKRIKPFGVKRFLYSGHSRKKLGDELGAEFVSLNELLDRSDFVVACVPLTSETFEMFDKEKFSKMKRNSVFVNVSRGKIVKTDDLVEALKTKTIYAAGLDVTEPEPLPDNHELLKLKNAVILPHIGSATIETRNRMSITAAQNILNALEGKPMVYEL